MCATGTVPSGVEMGISPLLGTGHVELHCMVDMGP